MKRLMKSTFVALLTAAAVIPGAQAAQVGLSIIETSIGGGPETASAVWSTGGGPILVTQSSADPEVWLIDLTASGHMTPGGDFLSFGNNGVMTWKEPEHPGMFNNLFFLDPFHWRLESEQAVAANTNNDGVFGIFDNGVSIFAGIDFNGDQVFVAINEVQVVPEPVTLALLGVGLAGLGFGRRRKSIQS